MFFGPRPAGEDAFSPASLFAGGEDGAWYDPSDLATVWVDEAGTEPATPDSPVARIDDKSGNGLHLTQTPGNTCPFLRTADGLYWLEFDGANDHLFSAGNLVLASAAASVVLGVEQTALTPAVTFARVGVASEVRAWRLEGFVNESGDVGATIIGNGGTDEGNLTDIDEVSWAAANVVTANFDRGAAHPGKAAIRVNGAAPAQSNSPGDDLTPGVFFSYPLYLGAADGPAGMLTGKIFGLVIRAGTLTAGQLSGLETWMQAKSGATF